MFSLVLKDNGKHKMIYATSNGFRMIFLGIALLIFVILLTASEGSVFKRANIVALSFCAICLISSLFLERWIFDKESNLFEKDVGLIFLYRKKRRSLDSLRRIVLDDFLGSVNANRSNRRRGSLISRRNIALYVQDRDGRTYILDIARGVGSGELRKTAQKLSEFCEIPLEDNRQDSDRQTPGDSDLGN